MDIERCLALTSPLKSRCPRLMRISEVEQDYDPLAAGLAWHWIRDFLGRPHPELGRHGSVCPFVPGALKIDSIYLAEMEETNPTFEHISAIITEYRNVFPETEPKSGPDAINKVFLVVFPASDKEWRRRRRCRKVQASLKRYFVDMGLMLGEFHSGNETRACAILTFGPCAAQYRCWQSATWWNPIWLS